MYHKIMKGKIGIITILKVNNYGAELQAYATQRILQLMGYDAEIIDYLFYKNPRHKRTKASAPTAKMSIGKHLKEFLFPIFSKWKSLKYNDARIIRESKFDSFHLENTKLSVCYESLDELKAADLDYNILIAGSDQIWNPGIYSSIDPYLLCFGDSDIRRISYASSFGVSSVPENVKLYYKKALQRFSAIGVREDAAVDLVRNFCGKDAQLVLDPTLLLNREQWMEVAKPIRIPSQPYILVYELSSIHYIKRVAVHISQLTGMPIVRVCKNACREDAEPEIINIIDAGPAEFLYLLDNAGYVITNSFHGTAFSLNFGKQFYTIIPDGKSNNSRQKSILRLMDAEDRILKENAPFPDIKPVDSGKVEIILQKERKKSMLFLKYAIDG